MTTTLGTGVSRTLTQNLAKQVEHKSNVANRLHLSIVSSLTVLWHQQANKLSLCHQVASNLLIIGLDEAAWKLCFLLLANKQADII